MGRLEPSVRGARRLWPGWLVAAVITGASMLCLQGAPAAVGHHANLPSEVEQWRGLVEQVFPPTEVEDVLSVIRCESYGNPNTMYLESWGLHSVGLLQINRGWLTGWQDQQWALRSHDGTAIDLTDPMTNILAARWIRHFEDVRGFKPWSQWACNP